MTPEQRAESLLRAYATVVLPDEVVADCDASAFVTRTTAQYANDGLDVAATMRNEGARMFWIQFRERVAQAKRPRPEPVPTHAISSTARSTP